MPCRTRLPALPPPAFATGEHLPRIGAKSRKPARSSSSNDTNAPARSGGGVKAQEHCEGAVPTESRCLKRIFVARLRLDQFQAATRQPAKAYPGSAMHQALWRPLEDLQDIPQRAFSTVLSCHRESDLNGPLIYCGAHLGEEALQVCDSQTDCPQRDPLVREIPLSVRGIPSLPSGARTAGRRRHRAAVAGLPGASRKGRTRGAVS